MVFHQSTIKFPEHKPERKADGFRAYRAGINGAHIVFIVDYSSSMQSCRDSTIDGFNEFLDTQKFLAKKEDINTTVSLYVFNGYSIECKHKNKDIKSIEKLNKQSYNPSGMTNLQDAIGEVMFTVANGLRKLRKRDRPAVSFAILTDGQENASSHFNGNEIKTMVKKSEKKDWTYMFMGANIDAHNVGNSYGFDHRGIIQYDTLHTGATFAAAARGMSDLNMAKTSGATLDSAYMSQQFTTAEASAAMGGSDETASGGTDETKLTSTKTKVKTD